MSLTEATYFGHPLFAVMALLSTGLLLYIGRDTLRSFARQRRLRQREQQRAQFWGYQ